MKSALFFITFFFTSFFCIAQSDNIEFDSLVNYQVKKKETLYSISKKYNVSAPNVPRNLLIKGGLGGGAPQPT